MKHTTLSRLLVAAALGTPPLVSSGCADPPAAANPAPSTARAADVSPLPLTVPTASVSGSEKALRDLATDADPRVQVAVLTASGIRESERKLSDLYTGLKPKLDHGRLGKRWQTQELSPAEFRTACRVLREMASDLEAAHLEFALLADRYEEQLARGPAAYRVAARYFEENSKAATERVFREGYAELALHNERFAAAIEDRKKAFARFRADVEEVRAFLKKTAGYVRDVEGFASSTPSAPGIDFRDSHRSFLLVYVRSFNEFLNLTGEFTDSLKARPLPPSPVEAPAVVTSGAKPGEHASRFSWAYREFAGTGDAEAAAIDQAVRKGETSIRYFRETTAEYGPLMKRIAPYEGKALPPTLKAELDDYDRRLHVTRSAELLTLKGTGPFVAPSGPPAGSYLPVIRDHEAKHGGPHFVGVMKVESVVGDRMTLRAVRGTPADGDVALYWRTR